ncbi:hypothetical protein J6590_013235 [Homalodisca vitripennis]|nr:hypothetical protein J6590_013235 [Homalodisca vitripennis]
MTINLSLSRCKLALGYRPRILDVNHHTNSRKCSPKISSPRCQHSLEGKFKRYWFTRRSVPFWMPHPTRRKWFTTQCETVKFNFPWILAIDRTQNLVPPTSASISQQFPDNRKRPGWRRVSRR